MEKYASPQGSDELEQSEWIRKGLELELVMARSKLENSRSVQAGIEFVLQIERAKYQRLEEKHAKKEVMKEKLIKKIAQIEESVLKVVRSTKQGNMNPEFWELLECERARREVMQCQLLEELADTKKKWAVSEASLDVKTHHCCDLEWEKLCMQNDMLKFEKIIQESKNLSDQSKNDIHTMKCALDSKKQDVFTISQKLQEALSASEALDKPIKTLEMSLQLMESENIKLKDVAKEQANRMSVVLKEAEKATLANKDLTKQLSQEVQKQTLLYIYAHGQLKQKEAILLNERQKASKAKAQQEALQERLEKVQNEASLLSQQLEAAKKTEEAKEQEVMQERLKTMHTENEMLALQERLENVQNEGSLLSQQLEAANKKAEAKEQEVMQERLKTMHTENEMLALQERLENVQNEGSLLSQQLEAANKKAEAKEQEVMQEHLKTMHTENEMLALQERLENVQNEGSLLSQQLEAANKKAEAKEQEVADMQERLKTMHTENEMLALQERLENVQNEGSLLSQQLEAANKKAEAKEQEVIQERLKTMHTENEMLALQERLENVQNEGTLLSQQLEAANKKAEAKEQEVMQERLKTMHTENEMLALQERLENVQNEGSLLSQQLEAANKKAEAKEQEVADMREHLKSMSTEKEMAETCKEKVMELLAQVRSVGEDTLRKLQQDLADTQTKLMTCEGLLEIHAVHCSDLEEENVSMEKDVGMLKRLLQESEDSCTQSESCIRNLVAKLNEKDNEIVTSSQKLLDLSDSGNKEPALKTTEIQEHPDGEDTDGWEMVWQLQQKVANAKIDLLACQASLKVNANHCRDLEEEKQSLQKDMITLKGSLREREDMCAQSEEHIQNLIASCNEKDDQIRTFSKQLQVSSASKIKKSKKENIQDSEETDRQNTLWRLQKELADTKTKLSAREASLKVNAKHCRDLEEEKHSMQTDISALKGRVWESEDKCTQSEERVCNLTASCEDKDHQICSLSKKLQVWSNSRSQEPDLKNTEIEEHLDNEETDTQSTVRQIQQELADTKRKLLTCEASLKVSANHCRDLEEEKQSLQNDMSTLKGRLWESEDKCAQSEELTHSMMTSCAEKDHQICALSKDLQVLSASKSKKSKKGKIQDSEETDRQNVVWQLQQELADTKTKLTTFEESLKVKSEHCRELEEESQSMQTDIVTLKGRLQETENMHVQSEKHICNLMATCDDKDHQICTLSKELQVLSASVGTDKTLEQAEESLDAVSQLEAEIASMQAVAEQQTGMIAALQKEVEEAAGVKKDLGELNQETKEQSSLSLKTDEQMKKRMAALQEEKEKANLQQEALQKQLEDMQNEKKVLHQQLKEAQMKEDTEEQVGTDVQNERFAKMQAHYEKKAEQQTGMIAALQKEVEEAAGVKKDLGELNQETKEQSSLSLKTDEQMKKRMAALQEEKEKANLQQEALQKQLEDMQNEKKVLHQQLKEAQMKEDTKEQVGTDVQNERFAKMQAHYEKKAKELEKRSKELASRYSALYGHLDRDKTDREHNWRQVKQDLADVQSKSLVDNVPLEVISRHCSNLEEKERPNMEQDLKSLEEMIKEFENCLEAVEGSG